MKQLLGNQHALQCQCSQFAAKACGISSLIYVGRICKWAAETNAAKVPFDDYLIQHMQDFQM